MREYPLTITARTGSGKELAAKIRQNGNLPGIIYGPELKGSDGTPKSYAVSFARRDLQAVLRQAAGQNFFVKVDSATPELAGRQVIVRDIQLDPVTDAPLHVDLEAVSLSKPMHVTVHVRLLGIPKGVKASGGILHHGADKLRLSCLPKDIPEFIDVDVSELDINTSIHVSDLKLENITVLTSGKQSLASVISPNRMQTGEAAAAPAGTTEAIVAEPEVITAKKPEAVAAAPEPKGKKK